MSRENFGSRTAYIMAMAGSAIGLGNIWRFPYMVGEYGGAAFIIVYLLCAVFVSMPIFFSEAIIGRTGRAGAFGSFQKLSPGTGWKNMGFFTIVSSFVIVSYYSVVGGWSTDYLVRSCAGQLVAHSQEEAGALFGHVSSSTAEPLIVFTVFLALTAVIVRLGIKKGIEMFSKITTPLLFVLIVAITIFSVSLPGAEKGIEYMLKPDFSKITWEVLAFAMGQSFFSMSLGVGCVLIYSSFMKEDENVFAAGSWTLCFDTLFAILAGFAIMPAVFAAGLEPGAGPSLVFETLPYIFTKMGEHAHLISSAATVTFFLAIFVAALTSAVSMFEVCVEFAVEKWRMHRRSACILIFAAAWILGSLCSLSFGRLSGLQVGGKNIFSICDILASNWFMTLGALAFAIYAGWVMKKDSFRDAFTGGGRLKLNDRIFPALHFMVKWLSPVMIVLIFVTNLIMG